MGFKKNFPLDIEFLKKNFFLKFKKKIFMNRWSILNSLIQNGYLILRFKDFYAKNVHFLLSYSTDFQIMKNYVFSPSNSELSIL